MTDKNEQEIPDIITIRKIAEEAQVSLATVSRVLNKKRNVGPDLAAYAGLPPFIHFIPVSLLFACAAMLFIRGKFSVFVPIVAVCAVAVIYPLFSFVFNVRLPQSDSYHHP